MVGNDLINYFSSTCKTQGEYTRQAINDSRSLMSILENIKNDPDCVTISGGISQLANLESKLQELQNRNSLNVEIEKLTAQENELLMQLNKTSDSDEREDINSAIREAQVNKTSLIAELSARDSLQGDNVKDLYARIVTSTNSLFTSVSNNYRCLEKNPNVLPAVTSLTGAIGSAAITVNPALGLGVAAATDFLGHTIESFRNRRYNRMIRRISDSGMALEGYKCVLESLSDRWCALEDAEDFLELKASIRRQTNDESGLLSAVRLQDRDIPVVLDWLNKVRTGVPAATTADATRQQEVFDKEAAVRSADALGNGVISQFRPLYDAFPGDEDKYGVLRSIIGLLTGNTCGGGSSYRPSSGVNPLNEIHSPSYAPFYLLGLSEIPRQGDIELGFCNFNPFTQWPNGTFVPNLNEVKNRYSEWVNRARSRVTQELRLVLLPDGLQVLTTATESTGNKWRYSAVDSFTNLIDFLENHIPERIISSSFSQIYQATLNDLIQLRATIDSAVNSDTPSDPGRALEKIFEIAKLEYGVIVIQSRLEMIVRVSVKEYLDSINNEESNPIAQLLAAESFLEVLSKINGTDNLALISADIKRAKPISIGNMNSFVEVFGRNINRILRDNHRNIQRTNDPTLTEVYSRNSAEICLLLSSMPEWPRRIDQDYCVGTKLGAVIPGGPESELITREYLNRNFNQRNCGYRNYIRKSKIYQDWGILL